MAPQNPILFIKAPTSIMALLGNRNGILRIMWMGLLRCRILMSILHRLLCAHPLDLPQPPFRNGMLIRVDFASRVCTFGYGRVGVG